MWTLEQALILIREIQPALHARKYHVALGGGVLNKGASSKDLDLYFFPFDVFETPAILPYLEELFGPFEPMWGKHEESIENLMADYPPDINFDVKVKFLNVQNTGKRIDAFLTKNGVPLGTK